MKKYTDIFGRLGNQMFQGAYLYAQVLRGEIPNIYLQDEKFFIEFKDEIRRLYGTDIVPLPYVSIHVRRGDYVNNNFYVDLFKDGYYERAMQLFPEEQFMVFSDEIDWCKRQEIFKNCLFSENFSEIKDMNRMAGCKAHIIANSSFSWWAAYISGNKTVAPEKWYSKSVLGVYTKLPDYWIKV